MWRFYRKPSSQGAVHRMRKPLLCHAGHFRSVFGDHLDLSLLHSNDLFCQRGCKSNKTYQFFNAHFWLLIFPTSVPSNPQLGKRELLLSHFLHPLREENEWLKEHRIDTGLQEWPLVVWKPLPGLSLLPCSRLRMAQVYLLWSGEEQEPSKTVRWWVPLPLYLLYHSP